MTVLIGFTAFITVFFLFVILLCVQATGYDFQSEVWLKVRRLIIEHMED